MFTVDDYINIFTYLKDGTASSTLDSKTLNLSLSERTIAQKFFENTLDQETYTTNDYLKMKEFLVDWYSTHRTILTTQKTVSDIYSMPSLHLNELLASFGFDVYESLRYMNPYSKILFFYELVNLYKVKGSPYSLFSALGYFGIPSLELIEYWLEFDGKITKEPPRGHLVFRGETVFATPGIPSSVVTDIDFSVVNLDPHWLLTKSQIINQFNSQKIRFPSKSPYYGIRPTFILDDVYLAMSIVSRKVQDDYIGWKYLGNNTRNIDSTIGYTVSFLELYLGSIYSYEKAFFCEGVDFNNFLCYDGTSTVVADISAEYKAIVKRPTSRQDKKDKYNLYLDQFSRPVTTHFLETTSVGDLLNTLYPEFKAEIDSYFAVAKEVQVTRMLLSDLSQWIINNLNLPTFNIASFMLDFDDFSLGYLKKVSEFFKPYRARLLFTEKIINCKNYLEDSIVAEDRLDIEIADTIIDWDTANHLPGILADYPVADPPTEYYQRNTFDTGSKFDVGASWDDESYHNEITEIIEDRLNVHPQNSDYYNYDNNDLGSGLNNLLLNGNFDYWTSGPSSAPDNWILGAVGATIARESVMVKNGTYSVKLMATTAGAVITQNIHAKLGISYWKGKTVTLGSWVWCDKAGYAYIEIYDGVHGSQSGYHPGDSAWHWLTCTYIVNMSATYVRMYQEIVHPSVAGLAYFNGSVAVEGLVVPQSIHTFGTSGGFVKFDVGWYFDKPFNNDYVEIIVTDI